MKNKIDKKETRKIEKLIILPKTSNNKIQFLNLFQNF